MLHSLLGLMICLGWVACEEYPDKFEASDGVPEIYYVRTPDKASADSLLDGGYLESSICIVGNNLTSVHEIWFNDQKALLNTSFITKNTLIVAIPRDIPEVVTDKMYLVNYDKDTVSYDFKVRVPAPLVASMVCEYVGDGEIATILGDYFIDDPNVPLEIAMAGNIPVTDIISIEKTKISFRIPEGSQKGYINVKTIYGVSVSKFHFRDERGIILDWDNLDAAGGWRSGNLAEEEGISGKYVVFKGNLEDGDWSEDNFSFNLWGVANERPEGDLFDANNKDKMQLKFEINIQGAWSCNAMQIVFTPWSLTGTNAYYSDTSIARALWIPWVESGSYETNGWTTVTIPMSDFKYTHEGANADPGGPGNWGGLSIFVWNGGIAGKPCSPTMWIDNIRVVPIE